LSQRHHFFGVAFHGENQATIQLCATCHELYHIIHRVFVDENGKAEILLDWYLDSVGINDSRFRFLYLKAMDAHKAETAEGQRAAKAVRAIDEYLEENVPDYASHEILEVTDRPSAKDGSDEICFSIDLRISSRSGKKEGIRLLCRFQGTTLLEIRRVCRVWWRGPEEP
jgi:hypothetical protein